MRDVLRRVFDDYWTFRFLDNISFAIVESHDGCVE